MVWARGCLVHGAESLSTVDAQLLSELRAAGGSDSDGGCPPSPMDSAQVPCVSVHMDASRCFNVKRCGLAGTRRNRPGAHSHCAVGGVGAAPPQLSRSNAKAIKI